MTDPTEHEKNLLGALLLSTSDKPIAAVLVDEHLKPHHFYRQRHALTFEAMVALYDRGEPVDTLTVQAELERMGELDAVDTSYLHALPTQVPAAGHYRAYASRVLELAKLRRKQDVAHQLVHAIETENLEAIAECEAKLGEVDHHRKTALSPMEWANVLLETVESGPPDAFSWPFASLDSYTVGGMRRKGTTLVGAWTNTGKAGAVDTPVPTPFGWRTMGDLQPGDLVFSSQGEPTLVKGVSPVQYGRPCYEVVFSDGARVVVDAEHQWLTWTDAARRSEATALRVGAGPESSQAYKRVRPSVVTTEEIAETLRVETRGGRSNHSIPLCGPLAYPRKDQPLDPYVLGAWLGDGTTTAAEITTVDPEVLDEIRKAGHEIRPRVKRYAHGIGSGCHRALRELGLLGGPKRIPDTYLYGSVEQRLALLQGLMDTDGHVDHRGLCEFVTVRPTLAQDVLTLALSLGLRATLRTGRAKLNGKDYGEKYRIFFTTATPVFRLPRKLAGLRSATPKAMHRYIREVRPVDSVPVKCIRVAAPDSLFLIGRECIPTHNSIWIDQVLEHAAQEGARAHLYINEMGLEERGFRIVSRRAGIPYKRLALSELNDQDRPKFVRALNELPFGVTECAGWTAEEIAHDIRRHRWDVCAVDILHRIPGGGEEKDWARMSSVLTDASKRANGHILIAVHLNEANAKSGKLPKPVLRDIRGSGSLKNDADNVLFLWRQPDGDTMGDEGRIYFAKVRSGVAGGMDVVFNPRRMRFQLPSQIPMEGVAA